MMVTECMNKDKDLATTLDLKLQKEFSMINDFPKLLAEYVDHFILKSGKAADYEQVLQDADKIFELVRLTAERDVFIYYYEIGLKGRLLSVSHYYEDLENEFLKKLNQLLGEQ